MDGKGQEMKERIFSGINERVNRLWNCINAINSTDCSSFIIWEAVYCLACRCRELEDKIDKLMETKKEKK